MEEVDDRMSDGELGRERSGMCRRLADKRRAKLLLTHRDPGPLFICHWSRLVLDEAHTIENSEAAV